MARIFRCRTSPESLNQITIKLLLRTHTQVYFVIFYVIGLYFLMNLLLATIYNDFRESTKNSMIEKTKRRKMWIERFWHVCEEIFQKKELNVKDWHVVCKVIGPTWNADIVDLTFRAVVGSKDGKLKRDTMRLTDFMHAWQYLQLRARGGASGRINNDDESSSYSNVPDTPVIEKEEKEEKSENISSSLVKRESFEFQRKKSFHAILGRVQSTCRSIVSSERFDTISDVLILVNAIVVVLMISASPDTPDVEVDTLTVFAAVFLTYFLFEMIVRILAAGGLKEFWIENVDRPLVRGVVSCRSREHSNDILKHNF